MTELQSQTPSHPKLKRAVAAAALVGLAVLPGSTSEQHSAPEPATAEEAFTPQLEPDSIIEVTPTTLPAHQPPAKELVPATETTLPEQTPNSESRPIYTPPPIHDQLPTGNISTPGIDTGGEQVELKTLPESKPITPEITETMRKDTVHLTFAGCSGTLIRNEQDVPVGYATAEHCGLRDTMRERIVGDDGVTYIAAEQPLEVQTGDQIDTMTTDGTTTGFVLHPEGDLSRDLALGVLDGHTAEEVLANYKHLSSEQLDEIPQGETLYMSGWPVDQDNNSNNIMHRQEFSMSVLGKGTVLVSSGELIDVMWAAAKSNADGAECSPGASGSEGFIEIDGERASVGVLATFDEFKADTFRTPEDAANARRAYEQQFGVDLSGFDAVCGFAYVLPTEVVAVAKAENIPGYEAPLTTEEFTEQARTQFFDPTYERTVVDGLLSLGGGKEGDFWIDRPTVFYDSKSNQVAVGYYSTQEPDNLRLEVIADGLNNLVVYDRDDEPGLEVLRLKGKVFVTPNDDGEPSDSFTDFNTLQTFSKAFSSTDPTLREHAAYTLSQGADGKIIVTDTSQTLAK